MSGTLFIISAASGTGKTSLVNALIATTKEIKVSISHTTRPQRPGEDDKVNYHFVNQALFLQMLANTEFLEHAQVFGNWYGTSKTWVTQTLNSGCDVILEIDWQGAEQVRHLFPQAVSIFILPPTIETLEKRLTARKQDSIETIQHRLALAQQEMAHYVNYDFVVINDDFNKAVEDLRAIVRSQRLRINQATATHQPLIQALLNPGSMTQTT